MTQMISFIKIVSDRGRHHVWPRRNIFISNDTDIIEHFILMAFPNDLMRTRTHTRWRRLKQHKFVGYNLVSSEKNDEIFIRLTIMTHMDGGGTENVHQKIRKLQNSPTVSCFSISQHPRAQFVFCFKLRKHTSRALKEAASHFCGCCQQGFIWVINIVWFTELVSVVDDQMEGRRQARCGEWERKKEYSLAVKIHVNTHMVRLTGRRN